MANLDYTVNRVSVEVAKLVYIVYDYIYLLVELEISMQSAQLIHNRQHVFLFCFLFFFVFRLKL